jgi:voltage-gated potassium channel
MHSRHAGQAPVQGTRHGRWSGWSLRRSVGTMSATGRIERRWNLLVAVALAVTVPAFYVELLSVEPSRLAAGAYAAAAAVVGIALLHGGWRSGHMAAHLRGNLLDLLLSTGLLAAALLPASQASTPALVLRLTVSFLLLLRTVWSLQHLISRGSLPYMLLAALGVLLLCGAGFRWLEPTTPTLTDGLWLAFTTAATVGYGDVVPTTAASKIFAVFVVMLGLGVLTLTTAALATAWIGTTERRIEREILHDLRERLDKLHAELAALRAESRPASAARGVRPPGDTTASRAAPRRSASRRSRSAGR